MLFSLYRAIHSVDSLDLSLLGVFFFGTAPDSRCMSKFAIQRIGVFGRASTGTQKQNLNGRNIENEDAHISRGAARGSWANRCCYG